MYGWQPVAKTSRNTNSLPALAAKKRAFALSPIQKAMLENEEIEVKT